jgi:cleavage and polyadenylation specificity factor subunit 1
LSGEAVGDSPTNNTTTQEYRHHVLDKRSKWYFLIDSDSAISSISTSFVNQQVKPGLLKLYAANTTEIDTYGDQNLELHLNVRRSFKWNFVIANVQSPIIGADLLSHYGLLIDLKNRRLIGSHFSQKRQWSVPHFMNITMISPPNSKSGTSVLHHTVTNRTPVTGRTRQPTEVKLTSVKAEFEYILQQGICQPSISPWATPLHLISQENMRFESLWRLPQVKRWSSTRLLSNRLTVYDFADRLQGKTNLHHSGSRLSVPLDSDGWRTFQKLQSTFQSGSSSFSWCPLV